MDERSIFVALRREASFTKEVLGAGATYIRNANYASDGIYFQAFTSLSTGLERMGKLCLMLDHYIDSPGSFDMNGELKQKVGHNLSLLYERSQTIASRRSLRFEFQSSLIDIHLLMTRILSAFAKGDRYANIDLLAGGARQSNPIRDWHQKVDGFIYEAYISDKKKKTIESQSDMAGAVLSQFGVIYHTAEDDSEITSFRDGSRRTGIYMAVAPYRQLLVLQVIRYWAEIVSSLGDMARNQTPEAIPYFGEIFGAFYNYDSYLRKRKTWNNF